MLTQKKVHVTIVGSSHVLRESLVNFFNSSNIYAKSVSMTDSLEGMSQGTDILLLQHTAASLRILREQAKELPSAKLLLFNVETDDIDVIGCLQLGIVGFVPVDADCKFMLDAVRAVVINRYVLPEQLQYRLYQQLSDRGKKQSHSISMQMSELTLRERQILELVTDGLANKEIAGRLSISTHTVKSHVHNILSKLRVDTRVGLVNTVWKMGLLGV